MLVDVTIAIKSARSVQLDKDATNMYSPLRQNMRSPAGKMIRTRVVFCFAQYFVGQAAISLLAILSSFQLASTCFFPYWTIHVGGIHIQLNLMVTSTNILFVSLLAPRSE